MKKKKENVTYYDITAYRLVTLLIYPRRRRQMKQKVTEPWPMICRFTIV